MINKLTNKSKVISLDICNKIWTNSTNIKDWNAHLIILILKPGKDPNDPFSYSPLALTSTLGKTFERLLKTRMMDWIGKTSTKLLEWIQERPQHHLLAISVNLSNAYSSVNINILINKMQKTCIPWRGRSAHSTIRWWLDDEAKTLATKGSVMELFSN